MAGWCVTTSAISVLRMNWNCGIRISPLGIAIIAWIVELEKTGEVEGDWNE